jgi:hypothetical protein
MYTVKTFANISQTQQHQTALKIQSAFPKLLHTDRQREMAKLTDALFLLLTVRPPIETVAASFVVLSR